MKRTAFDFIVLGAGAAGCAAARALAAKYPSASVALVEQGGRRPAPPPMGVPALQPFIAVNRKARPFLRRVLGETEVNLGGRALEYVRGRGLGGSTLCNNMRYLRGTAADFAAWGDPSWTWEAMLPFFTSLEANTRGEQRPTHGDAGPLAVSDASRSNIDASLNVRFYEACEAAGVPAIDDFNGGDADGFSCFQSLIQRGTRLDVFDALVEQNQHRTPNLCVLTDTRAEQIVFEGRRAVGVLVVDGPRGREAMRLDCGNLLICLGALDTPALLQRSGVGSAGVVLDLPAVGQNLIQGCTADLVFCARNGMGEATSKSFSLRNLPYLRRQWHEYQEEHTGIFATLAEAGAFLRSHASNPRPDLSLVLYRTPQLGWHGWRRTLRPMDGLTVRVTHHYPASRGEVTWDAQTGRIRVRSGLLSEKADVVCMDEGVQWVGLLFSHESALKSIYHRDDKDNHVGPFWRLRTQLVYPSEGLPTQRATAAFLAQYATGCEDLYGTCAVGTVVDSSLRVRGLEGVTVADASVVPAPTIASSSVLGAAIGSRAASLL